jgi:hypothetical protein
MITSMDLAPIITHNPALGGALCICILSSRSLPSKGKQPQSQFPSVDPQNASKEGCLSVLASLPPNLPSFDLFGKLLRDETPAPDQGVSVGELVRVYALGPFTQGCIAWIDSASAEQRAGVFSDDRVSQSIANVRSSFSPPLFANKLIRCGLC